MILKSGKRLLVTIALTFISILVFDLLISSSSIVQLRIIFNGGFAMVMFVVIYVSVLLLNNQAINRNDLVIVFPRISIVIPILLNLNAVISIVWLSAPNIGYLNKDILFQGASSLLPLLDFLTIMTVNGIFLYFAPMVP